MGGTSRCLVLPPSPPWWRCCETGRSRSVDERVPQPNQLESSADLPERLGITEKEPAMGPYQVRKLIEYAPDFVRAEVDEHVPAEHHRTRFGWRVGQSGQEIVVRHVDAILVARPQFRIVDHWDADNATVGQPTAP